MSGTPALLEPRPSPGSGRFPRQALSHLDTLWIQVAGTTCNLECAHCFISSGPANHSHPLMSRTEVAARIAEALPLGVRELYFTGGEPFVHPEILEILADSLVHAPCTVLTNGTLLTPRRVEALRVLGEGSRYALELRVSLDGHRADDHDRFRGPGAFERALRGLAECARQGLLPIVTATQAPDDDPEALAAAYAALLREAGIARPRLKLLPMFRFGREAERTRGYVPGVETLAGVELDPLEPARLQCHACRAVSARGVFVCPLLVDEPGGRLGDRLDQALAPFELSHGACYTCFVTGMTCANG